MIRLTLLALLLPTSAWAGWQDTVDAARQVCDTDASICDVVDHVVVRENRAGLWFVQDARLTVDHLPALLQRMLAEDDTMMRMGLATGVAQLLPEAGAEWHDAWVHLASVEPDARVRSIFITDLRRAPLAVAGPGLRAALTHAEPVTRRDAAAIMGRHLQADAFVDDLLGALGDADLAVDRSIVRALGHVGHPKAAGAVADAMQRDDRLREEGTRTLERLQP